MDDCLKYTLQGDYWLKGIEILLPCKSLRKHHKLSNVFRDISVRFVSEKRHCGLLRLRKHGFDRLTYGFNIRGISRIEFALTKLD